MSRLLISCSHLFISFGFQTLFEDLSLSVHEGDVFALIGENGSGKTTLLQVLAGELRPHEGHVEHGDDARIGLFSQEEKRDCIVREYLGGWEAWEQKMALLLEEGRLEEWERVHEAYEKRGGYRRLPVESVLKGLKLEDRVDEKMQMLSCGECVRVGLAKAVMEEPDLLLLDEPTNHLDAEMIKWLKGVIAKRWGAVVIVSHDRKFINETCNRLMELREGKLTCYGGNYDFYLEEQKRSLERRLREYEEQEKERVMLKNKIREATFSKARPNMPKDRNVMAYDRRGEHHQRSMQRNLDLWKARLEEIDKNRIVHPKAKSITGLRFTGDPVGSSVAVELENVGKRWGSKWIFSGVNKVLKKRDRIVLRGPNGCGKSTLLRCAGKMWDVEEGIVRHSLGVRVGYLDQETSSLPMEKTVMAYFADRFSLEEEGVLRELHKAGLGSGDLLERSFAELSVGQRKRMLLLSLVMEKPNVLLLDEPTNHLDLLTVEALEKALLEFEGAVLAVSHDQTFIEKIATEVWDFY